jgi:hypothetical protein
MTCDDSIVCDCECDEQIGCLFVMINVDRSVQRNGGYDVGDDADGLGRSERRAWRRAHQRMSLRVACHAMRARRCGSCSWRPSSRQCAAQKVRFLFLSRSYKSETSHLRQTTMLLCRMLGMTKTGLPLISDFLLEDNFKEKN